MLPAQINLSVNRDSPISAHDQLVEQIGLQIASGILQGGSKLPSIRAMAKKLSIHHSVVNSAYNTLAEIGMLEIRHGSGARVMPSIALGQNKDETDLSAMFLRFVNQANKSGYSNTEIVRCCDQFAKRGKIRTIIVADANADFHPVILAELAPHFSIPVIAYTPEQLHADHSILQEALLITSVYHFLAVRTLPIDPTRFMICSVEPAQELANKIKTLPDNGIVLLISVSPTLLKIGSNIAAAIRGDSIVVRTVLTNDSKEIINMMQYSKLVACDLPSKDEVKHLASKIPVHLFNLYSDTTIQLIKDNLNK